MIKKHFKIESGSVGVNIIRIYMGQTVSMERFENGFCRLINPADVLSFDVLTGTSLFMAGHAPLPLPLFTTMHASKGLRQTVNIFYVHEMVFVMQ